MTKIANIDEFLDQQTRLDAEYRRTITVHTLPCVDCGTMVTGSLSDGTYLDNEYSDGVALRHVREVQRHLPSQRLRLSRVSRVVRLPRM